MRYLFLYHEVNITFLFIGIMIGTLPSVFKEANKNGFKKDYILPFIIAFSVTTSFAILENNVIDIIPKNNYSLVALVMYGLIIGFGTIIPGVSSSFILMYIGAYEIIIDGIASIDLMVLIPAGIGFAISILLFARLINFFFKRFFAYTYYAILGFVLGSIIAILPSMEFSMEYLLGTIICGIGFFLSYRFSKW